MNTNKSIHSLLTLGMIALGLTLAGCGRSETKGKCSGDSNTICALRTGTQTVTGQQAFVVELDVPRDVSATYEVYRCPSFCDFQPSYVIRCTGNTCVEQEQTANQPAIVTVTNEGKLIRFEHLGFTGSQPYRARVAPSGGFVNGTALQ